MKTFRAVTACLILVAVAELLSGCAGTARGSRSSVLQTDASVDLTDYSLSRADALVVIRYPAIIHADAEKPYFHAFSISAIGGEVPPANRTKKVTTRIAQSVIAKSNYYVMSLYRELGERLPKDSVLLSPHVIELDENQRLTSRALLASEQVPTVVTIDFNVGYGFTAIIVAFLGRLNPIGIVLAGLLMALTYIGGDIAQSQLQLPAAAIQVFQGMLLFFLLAFDLFTNYRLRLGRHEVA